MKFFKSLQAKYMLIVITALFFVYILFLATSIAVFNINGHEELETAKIEREWHREANAIENPSMITELFEHWTNRYPDASMFWINEKGRLTAHHNLKEDYPPIWDASYTAKFIKERYDNDPFTVIAFVGEEQKHGFLVYEIPRDKLEQDYVETNSQFLSISVPLGIILFIFVSYLFFRKIRKRLVNLQDAMEIRDTDGLPIAIPVKKEDEIGSLENAFNQMVDELRKSRKREQEEEQLRKELIANLSHDIRTPLTKIRAHSYTLQKENLSEKAQESIKNMNESINKMDTLIENLMSYTLLHANKYEFKPVNTDVVRLLRKSIASWYPLFEKNGFDIDVQLENFKQKDWNVDPLWMERIFDNLFQNVIRHAADGKYIGLRTESTDEYDALIIADRGKGMNASSNEKGAGIGLSIVDMMIKSMNLDWKIDSTNKGTTIKILRYKSFEKAV